MTRPTSRILLSLLLLAVSIAPQPALAEVFNVRGMWAEFCEDYVEGALLGGIDGIVAVDADHEEDVVSVVFDPTTISPEQIAAVMEDCPLMRVTDSETHELDRDEIRRHQRCWGCFLARDQRGERR